MDESCKDDRCSNTLWPSGCRASLESRPTPYQEMDAASMSSIASASSSEVAVMAERGLRRAATAPVADRYNLTPPPEIHTPGRSRTNRFVVDSRQMEQILRNRHLSAPDLSTTVDNDSSTESEQTLTPISRDDREETQGTIPSD